MHSKSESFDKPKAQGGDPKRPKEQFPHRGRLREGGSGSRCAEYAKLSSGQHGQGPPRNRARFIAHKNQKVSASRRPKEGRPSAPECNFPTEGNPEGSDQVPEVQKVKNSLQANSDRAPQGQKGTVWPSRGNFGGEDQKSAFLSPGKGGGANLTCRVNIPISSFKIQCAKNI